MRFLSSIKAKISPFGRPALSPQEASRATALHHTTSLQHALSSVLRQAYAEPQHERAGRPPSALLLPNLRSLGLRLQIGIALLFFMCGCNSTSGIKPEQAVAPLLAVGSGAAGYLAAKDQDDDERALITGAAALGGLAVGSFIADDVAEAKRKEFRDGYNLARSNDIKRLYWRQQAQHRAKPDEPRLKYYAFPGRESGDDGEKLMKHDVVMPVME